MSVRSIKSAERTLALFELFSIRESRLTVSEVARELSIPQPSASMLLRNLADLGYLDYDRLARTYGPTIRVLLLSNWISPCNVAVSDTMGNVRTCLVRKPVFLSHEASWTSAGLRPANSAWS